MTETRALTVQDTREVAELFAKSGMFSDVRDMAQAFVKIQAGREIGVEPFAAMTGIHIIKGKPTLGAGLIAGRIKASGKYDYRVVQHDDTQCVIEFYQGEEKIGISAFTMKDAQAAGLLNNPTWKGYPKNMLFARALSNGARWYTPDVFNGSIYTPEELGDGDAEIIDVTPIKVEEPAPGEPTHWIDDSKTRARFWAWAKNDLSLSEAQVHEALNVESVTDYGGSKQDAMSTLTDFADWLAEQEPAEVAA